MIKKERLLLITDILAEQTLLTHEEELAEGRKTEKFQQIPDSSRRYLCFFFSFDIG